MKTQLKSENASFGRLILPSLIWILLLIGAGYVHLFNYFPGPIIGITSVLLSITLIFAYSFFPRFNHTINAISLKNITQFHVLRIMGGLLFIQQQNLLPKEFVLNAAYGDILSGIIALLVSFSKPNTKLLLLFNIIGSLDLINALRIGMHLALSGNLMMRSLGNFPLIFIILLIVPVLIFLHAISFKRLYDEGKNLKQQIIY